MLLLLIVIIGATFLLTLGYLILSALFEWASRPPPARMWKDWFGIGVYGLSALLCFALYFQTAAIWTLGFALLFAVVALTSALRSINSGSSAEPTAPRP